MAKKNGGWVSWILFPLLLLVSGCSTGLQSETIIITDSDEMDHPPQDSSPVQVKKIYRLSDENADTVQWLGWSSTDSIVGTFKAADLPERFMIRRLAYPFEQSENITEINMNTSRISLSPDGKHVAEMTMSRKEASLKLNSLKDLKKTEIDKFSASSQMFLQDMSWSDNSQYISYLVLDSVDSSKKSLRLFDTKTGLSKPYALNEFEENDTLISIHISNDGRSALIMLYESDQPVKKTMVLGKLIDDHFEAKYKRQTGENQVAWIGNDQFAFLERDGTLYEYDMRNGELSVILEKVYAYAFSQDKKFIAYSLQGEDVVYVGKMQGRNVLYNKPVYHGIIPMNLKWNSENSRLLIQGSSAFTNPNIIQTNYLKEPSLIIELE
ncbi:hypothetical protein D3P07_15890 [Paenibacillus sp. 1011MAR3C5]|uniref:hypothetical protein n=1 Tax=Paenibacillus sp. 1011MAR3C5 TaxID=1675787 RepID=UPI000E6BBB62|nr:hypothetical protein [Paenibacillus sp. 1011MAR3C5]RJE87776.1 hypothetical protein D3P07_15890 [Paenibacillus sp. 1011MAR3C5]